MINFRTLYADEIETRAARCTEKGVQLLLYKDARCDMSILDETVGPGNWQRKHSEHNDNLFCMVGINTNYANDNLGSRWVWKEDAGAESNTEAEKGHASDSFKRACVNWGIGRELYTSPFIWISGATEQKNGKWVCSTKFYVDHIAYDDKRRITELVIVDKAGTTAFSFGVNKPKPAPKEPAYFRCDECGQVLKPYTNNGVEIGLRRHAEGSIKKYGRVLCLECIKKQQGEER